MQDYTKQEVARQRTYHAALAQLAGLKLDLKQVRRVAVERNGVLHIEVHEAGKRRYFVFELNELRELHAGTDLKIPFIAKLPGFDDQAIISYRPGRRIVLGPASGNIVKAYKKRRAVQAAVNHAIARSACEQGGYDVPRLLQVETDNDYLCMSRLVGQTPEIAAGATAVWAVIGSRLRRFQRFSGTDGLDEFSHVEELAVLNERARRFLLCMPVLPGHWLDGLKCLEDLAAILPSAVKGLAHRDLHDRQFIVTDETVGLLDFDLICVADVALDAANLLTHMRLRTLQGSQGTENSALPACSEAFLTGLGRQDEAGFPQRLLFYQASTYFRLALLYALRPRWAHLTDILIDEGRNCINVFNQSRARS